MSNYTRSAEERAKTKQAMERRFGRLNASNKLLEKIINKELTICETCNTIFAYVPQKIYCAECMREKTVTRKRMNRKAHYEANREKEKARNRAYYKANREKMRAQGRARYHAKKRRLNIEEIHDFLNVSK